MASLHSSWFDCYPCALDRIVYRIVSCAWEGYAAAAHAAAVRAAAVSVSLYLYLLQFMPAAAAATAAFRVRVLEEAFEFLGRVVVVGVGVELFVGAETLKRRVDLRRQIAI